MINVDYSYYTDDFMGDILTSDNFARYIKRATPYVSSYTFAQADTVDDNDPRASSVKDALCAVADVLCTSVDASTGEERGPISSESVGGSWSRSYAVKSQNSNDILSPLDQRIKDRLYIILSNTGLLYAGEEI